MVPLNRLSLEQERDDDGENGQGNHFLNHLQLHQVERAAISDKADAVGRNGETVLEKGNSPGKEDNQDERPARGDFHLLKLQMAVPGERHENVRKHKH